MGGSNGFNVGTVKRAAEAFDAQAGMFLRGHLATAMKKRDFKGTAWGVAILSLLLFFYVWQHMQVVKMGYEVQALRAEKKGLTNEYYYLKYKLYDVRSLSRVEKTAREELGMETPRADQVVILEDGNSASRWLTAWLDFTKKLN